MKAILTVLILAFTVSVGFADQITSIGPNPVTLGTADPRIDVPIGKWWDINFNLGRSRTLHALWEQFLERYFLRQHSRMLSPKEATTKYGIKGVLEFREVTLEVAAQQQRQEALADIERSTWTSAATHSWYSWKGISGFLVMLIGHISRPLDFWLLTLILLCAYRSRGQHKAEQQVDSLPSLESPDVGTSG